MNALAPSRTRIQPVAGEEHRLVRNELAALLKTPHFSNSKRYPALLSYIVEKTLAGRSDELKERILGIEVFHRQPDYDTNSDTASGSQQAKSERGLPSFTTRAKWNIRSR